MIECVCAEWDRSCERIKQRQAWEQDRKERQTLRSITLSKEEQEYILDSKLYSCVNDRISFSGWESGRQQWDSVSNLSVKFRLKIIFVLYSNSS